ncbi:branched-chain amino acid ABC transporter permease [Intrasporangium chromatireducens Q5-1]|uniref:Branched-chain amino acid ABC transporter permease n=1 Tax=Intrasporangium chromatireducens Q5-1 TaxID=584657 RepID=W9GMC8_9MICO|nr:branched-chain amino acid ABC transporter permease [Intrasporangium chromatireducens]EWT06267.1 branched-chain amino acid ABC transporter permease [Intrasporangium chromatireducens Q5-1]
MVLLQVLVSGLLLGGVYSLVSVGLTVVFGVVRISNFAHGAFVMLGMYSAYWAHELFALDPYVAAVVIVPLFFLLGMGVYQLAFRHTIGKDPLVQIFVSVGLLVALENLALFLFGADFRTVRTFAGQTAQLGPVNLPVGLLIAFVVSLAVALALMALIQRTKLGRATRAVTQDRVAATLMGVSTHRMYSVAFGISIACTGLAGSLLMPIKAVYPTVGTQFTLVAFVIVVLGGMGSVSGALIGGLVVGLVESLAGYYVSPAYQQLAYFVVFIIVLLARPQGLFGSAVAAEIGEEA